MKTNETNTEKPNGTGAEPNAEQESHNANESIKNKEGELNEAGARATAHRQQRGRMRSRQRTRVH